MLQPGQDLLGAQRSEPEPRGAALQGGDDLAEVVADQAKPEATKSVRKSRQIVSDVCNRNIMVNLRMFILKQLGL